MKNIVLFGFMGSGKSTVAKSLSRKLNLPIVEMDAIIEKEEQKTINHIFAEHGEEYFRELEHKLIIRLCDQTDQIISTGGGVIKHNKNVELLKEKGITFSLVAKPETIYNRVKHSNHRPLLKTDDPLETIKELLSSREEAYRKAEYVIETDDLSIEQVADKICNIVNIRDEK